MPRGLTGKQSRFVEEYLIDQNASAAAVRAGYSEHCAGVQGHENLRKPNIKAAIDAAIEERAERTKVTQDWVIERLKIEALNEGEGASHSARVAALEKLGKHLKMFVDVHEQRRSYEHMSDEELEREYVRRAAAGQPPGTDPAFEGDRRAAGDGARTRH